MATGKRYRDRRRGANRMAKFRIREISLVGTPAQEGAEVVIAKHDNGKPIQNRPTTTKDNPAEHQDLKKRGDLVDVLTSVQVGHQHGISFQLYDGALSVYVSYSRSEGDEYGGHDHQIARDADGNYEISTVQGHTHTVSQDAMEAGILGLIKEEDPMKKDANGKFVKDDGAEFTLEELQALEKDSDALKKATTVLALSPEHRAYYDGLSTDEFKASFLGKSADERTTLIKKAEEAAIAKAADENPILYTTTAGVQIRKSDGQMVADLAKRADDGDRRNAELEKKATDAEFEKRAETELKHLPGTVQEHAALLKAAEGIEDESLRKAAVAALRAQDKGLSKAFETAGARVTEADPEAPDAQIEKMVANYQKDNPTVNAYDAHQAVLRSEEGAALYRQAITQ